MSKIRRKGLALVETKKGILVVAGKSKKFSLPGGGANIEESRKKAAIRELKEETGIKAKNSKYFLSYKGYSWKTHKGIKVKNHAKVFVIQASGKAKPKNEIKYISYWTPNSKIRISKSTRWIINKYMKKIKNMQNN